MKRWIWGALLCIAAPVQAGTLDLNIGRDNVRLNGSGPLSHLLVGSRGQYDLGLLAHREKGADDYLQAHAGVVLTGDAGARDANVIAGLGLRAVALDEGAFNASALQLGGQLEVRVPEINRLSFHVYLWGAPTVLTWGDADAVYEYATDIDYQVIREASVYVGYRQVKVDAQGAGTTSADTGFHLGFRFRF